MAAEPEVLFTNIRTFLAIAKESFAKSEKVGARQRRPRTGGGFIIRLDPNQKSFKLSMIAIVFAGVYLEALLYLQGCRLIGVADYKKVDRSPYEVKLAKLGVTDQELLDSAKEFRLVRRELVHEKAHQDTNLRTAQDEARKAIVLIDRIARALREVVKIRT